jgi:hypothetical protein
MKNSLNILIMQNFLYLEIVQAISEQLSWSYNRWHNGG